MKRMLSIALALTLLVVAAGCSGEQQTDPTIAFPTEPTAEPTAEPTVEPTTEPTTESTTEPITEPIAEPTTEPIAEPTTEPTTEPMTEPQSRTYILNTNSKVFHEPGCSSVKSMKETNKQEFVGTREDAIAMGYKSCGRCHP